MKHKYTIIKKVEEDQDHSILNSMYRPHRMAECLGISPQRLAIMLKSRMTDRTRQRLINYVQQCYDDAMEVLQVKEVVEVDRYEEVVNPLKFLD